MRPTPNDVHVVWLDRVQIDHSIDAHDIDVIRALCEVCEPPLTVARLFELLQGEQDETVRCWLVEVIRQRAARGEGREVAECYVRMMLQRGARTLTAERVAEAVGVSLRVAGEVLMEYARGGVVRTRVSGRRVTVYRLQPAEGGQVSVNPVQVEDSAGGRVSCEPVQAGGCDHNLLEVVSALQATPKLLVHTAARLVSTSRERALCVACDEIRRMLVLVRDEASAGACIARARGLLAQVARAEGARQEQPDQYRLDGLYTERELGWIPHILEFVESRKRVLPFYVALHLRDKLRLSHKEMAAVQDLVWRMASSGDAGLRLVGAMVERVPIVCGDAAG